MIHCVECLLQTYDPKRSGPYFGTAATAMTVYDGAALCFDHLRDVLERPSYPPPSRHAHPNRTLVDMYRMNRWKD